MLSDTLFPAHLQKDFSRLFQGKFYIGNCQGGPTCDYIALFLSTMSVEDAKQLADGSSGKPKKKMYT